ncbi:MAG TPA: DUF4349 domain-containing protein [Paracoccaceae bacterium]|nr:DUF4349 domain-containing protein [Paracoccaceae bacterium]
MRKALLFAGALALLVGGCGNNDREVAERATTVDIAEAPQNDFGFMEAQETPILPSVGVPTGPSPQDAASDALSEARSNNAEPAGVAPDAAAARQIAYSYNWGFRVDAESLPVLQQRHRALCEDMGSDCRILSLSQSGDTEYAYGSVRMQVVASRAKAFGEQLAASTEGVDAEQVSFAIAGEDLTDNITDTEARLAGRRLLRDRLMEVLRNRQGSVADLVAAERGVAEVNEEIDAATARLATMRNSVAYSAVAIEYDPMLGQYQMGFSRPIAAALESAGSTLGVVVAGLIYLVVALVPIGLFVIGVMWLWRRRRVVLGPKSQAQEVTEEPAP